MTCEWLAHGETNLFFSGMFCQRTDPVIVEDLPGFTNRVLSFSVNHVRFPMFLLFLISASYIDPPAFLGQTAVCDFASVFALFSPKPGRGHVFL